MNAAFCFALSFAFELEELDLTGDIHVGDDGLMLLPKGEVKNTETKAMEIIGLPRLRVIKFGGLAKMTDHSIMKIAHSSNVLEHLELSKCEQLTEYSIENIIKSNSSLMFLDLNGIPTINQ